MTTRFVLLGLLVAASPVTAQQLQSQPPQRWILGANVGGSSSSSDLQSTADWKTGFSAGANVAYRVEPKFAVRADANYAKNDLSTTGTTPTTFGPAKPMDALVPCWIARGKAVVAQGKSPMRRR